MSTITHAAIVGAKVELTDYQAAHIITGGPTLTDGIVNVKDSGAIGDDSHDDTSAITAAIALIPATGGTLYFPAGTYKITSTLTFNKPASLILGAGSEYGGSTIHMATANTRAWNIAPTLDGTRDQTNLMRGLLIKGPGSASSGEGVYALSDVHLENVGIVGFFDGLYWDSSTFYSRAYGCFFTANAHAGIKMTNTNNCTIDSCRITGNFGGGGIIGAMQYGVIAGFGSPTGLATRIVNSSIEYFSLDGISIDGGRAIVISGNYFETQQSTTGHAHIALGGSTNCFAVTVQGNYLQGDGTSGFNAIKTDNIVGLTVAGNYFGINAAIGITSTANSSQFMLLNNKYTGSPTLTLPASTITIDDQSAPPWVANPMTTAGDIIIATTAGAPIRLAKGADATVLTIDSSTHLPAWDAAASGFANPMTTKGDVIVGGTGGSAARLAIGTDTFVLTADSGSTNGIKWAAGGGGGGVTQAFAGYNTIGGSFETCSVNSQFFAKSITLANACTITSIDAYLNASAGAVIGPGAALYADNSGAPGKYLGGVVPGATLNFGGNARWVTTPLGMFVASGTYWLVIRLTDIGGAVLAQIAYDVGTDQKTTVNGAANFPDGVGTLSGASRQYSIRANTLR